MLDAMEMTQLSALQNIDDPTMTKTDHCAPTTITQSTALSEPTSLPLESADVNDSCELCYSYDSNNTIQHVSIRSTKSTQPMDTQSHWILENNETTIVDAPIAFGGHSSAPSPLSTFLVSASASQQLTMNIILATDGRLKSCLVKSIQWINVFAKVNTELMETGINSNVINSGTWNSITFVAELDGHIDQYQLEYLTKEVERRCPIIQLLLHGGTIVYNDWYIKDHTPKHLTRSISSNSNDSNDSSSSYNRRLTVSAAEVSPQCINTWSVDEFFIRVDSSPLSNTDTVPVKGASPLSTFLASIASCMQVTATLILSTDPKFSGKVIDQLQWTDVYGIYDSRALLHGINTVNNTFDTVVLRAEVCSNTITQSDLEYMVREIQRRCPQSLLLSKAGATVDMIWTLVG